MATKRWSQEVTDSSDALDIEDGVFEQESPRAIAQSLKRSAERSHRKKGAPFQSAMSMLSFYINRAGKGLSGERKVVLETAKDALDDLYGRPAARRVCVRIVLRQAQHEASKGSG